RHLQVPHLESLSHGQLEKIYQEFVVPQPRRQPRDRASAATTHPPTMGMPMEVEQLTQRIKTSAMLGQKRPLPVEQSSSDYKVVKQIKMDLQ
ncbi:hypothetical protein KR059_002889, partial [Drosophila kikkawai]